MLVADFNCSVDDVKNYRVNHGYPWVNVDDVEDFDADYVKVKALMLLVIMLVLLLLVILMLQLLMMFVDVDNIDFVADDSVQVDVDVEALVIDDV